LKVKRQRNKIQGQIQSSPVSWSKYSLAISSWTGRRERRHRATIVADAHTGAGVSGSYDLPQLGFCEVSEGFLVENELFHCGNTSGGRL